MARAAKEDNAGRAPADLTLLLFVAFVALNMASVVRAGFIVIGGDLGGGLQALVGRLSADLMWPLLVLLGGVGTVTIAAGKRRQLGGDGDLACVAFAPAVLFFALGVGVDRNLVSIGASGRAAVAAAALVWFAAGVVFAIERARQRVGPVAP